ncbi:hypothetical protein WCE17_29295, partial [Klebsiella pneumoniae]
RLRFSGPKTSIICSPMTSLKTSIKNITYLSDIGCLEIQGASLLSLHHLAYFYGTFSDSALERRNFANRKLQRHGRWAGDHVIPVDDLPGTGDVV